MALRDRIIELRRVKSSELVPNPKNWRGHPEAQRKALATIVDEIGYAGAQLVRELDDGRLMLIDGHLRRDMFGDEELPVLVTDLSKDEADAILATFDPIGAMAAKEDEALKVLLLDVDAAFDGMGGVVDAVAEAFEVVLEDDEPAADPGAQIDRAEELNEIWQVQPGDLYEIKSVTGDGTHRLLCGDSTNADDVARVMGGEQAGAVVTDPPYGIDATNQTLGIGKKEFYRGDWDKKRPDIKHILLLAPIQIIWGGNYFSDVLPVTNDWLCWHKKNDGLSFSEFELAWSNMGKNCRILQHHWSNEEKKHPTQKPLPVMAWCVELVDANTFIDPFGGSGTTMVACEQLQRQCRMIEIEPQYCAVILQRMSDMGCQIKRANSDG